MAKLDTKKKKKKKRCKLLEIAPELRNRIYNEVFPEGAITIIDYNYDFPPLLKTCKQVHDEATRLFYASTTFLCVRERFSPGYIDWYNGLPSKYSSLIQRFRYISRSCATFLQLTSLYVEGGSFKSEFLEDGTGVYNDEHDVWENEEIALHDFDKLGINRAKVQVPWLIEGNNWEWKTLEETEHESRSWVEGNWV